MLYSSTVVILAAVVWILTGTVQTRGSNPTLARYKPRRYGNYYSTVYFSYTGGKGYARYSRVYSKKKNLYPSLYSYMFKWLNTDEYKVYKNSTYGSISICKNYEANENGTYLGIFTCPLPFVPKDFSYCCGYDNAQYCCRFWDLKLNVVAVAIAALVGIVLLIISIRVMIQICIIQKQNNKAVRRRKAIHKAGMFLKRGRQVSLGSVWAHALFTRLHTESNYSEGTTFCEDEDSSDAATCQEVQETIIKEDKSSSVDETPYGNKTQEAYQGSKSKEKSHGSKTKVTFESHRKDETDDSSTASDKLFLIDIKQRCIDTRMNRFEETCFSDENSSECYKNTAFDFSCSRNVSGSDFSKPKIDDVTDVSLSQSNGDTYDVTEHHDYYVTATNTLNACISQYPPPKPLRKKARNSYNQQIRTKYQQC